MHMMPSGVGEHLCLARSSDELRQVQAMVAYFTVLCFLRNHGAVPVAGA